MMNQYPRDRQRGSAVADPLLTATSNPARFKPSGTAMTAGDRLSTWLSVGHMVEARDHFGAEHPDRLGRFAELETRVVQAEEDV